MKKAQQLPNGYFNKLMTTYINLDVGKSSPLRKMNVDDDFCRTYGICNKPIPLKVLEHFNNLERCHNFDFINYGGSIWRRDNNTHCIEWHRITPEFILP